MPVQTLILKLDGITAGDYLTWCRDPDPPALDFGLRRISIDADPQADTIIATLDWNAPPPGAEAAAAAAGLPLSAGVEVDQRETLTRAAPARRPRGRWSAWAARALPQVLLRTTTRTPATVSLAARTARCSGASLTHAATTRSSPRTGGTRRGLRDPRGLRRSPGQFGRPWIDGEIASEHRI